MAMSLQSITELSVYPWENITGPGPLLNKSNFALPMSVPLFCQGCLRDIFYFLEVLIGLFWGCSWFRLNETLPFLPGSLYHDHFCCLALLWMEDICSVCLFVFSFLELSFRGLNNDTFQFMMHDPSYSLQDPQYFLSFFISILILHILPFPSLHYSNYFNGLIRISWLYMCLPKCALLFYMHFLLNYVSGMMSNISPFHSLKNQHRAFKIYLCCYVDI